MREYTFALHDEGLSNIARNPGRWLLFAYHFTLFSVVIGMALTLFLFKCPVILFSEIVLIRDMDDNVFIDKKNASSYQPVGTLMLGYRGDDLIGKAYLNLESYGINGDGYLCHIVVNGEGPTLRGKIVSSNIHLGGEVNCILTIAFQTATDIPIVVSEWEGKKGQLTIADGDCPLYVAMLRPMAEKICIRF